MVSLIQSNETYDLSHSSASSHSKKGGLLERQRLAFFYRRSSSAPEFGSAHAWPSCSVGYRWVTGRPATARPPSPRPPVSTSAAPCTQCCRQLMCAPLLVGARSYSRASQCYYQSGDLNISFFSCSSHLTRTCTSATPEAAALHALDIMCGRSGCACGDCTRCGYGCEGGCCPHTRKSLRLRLSQRDRFA